MPRFNGGWVKFHREMVEKDLNQNLILWGIWTHLLLVAVYKDSQIIWRGKQRILEPGSCVIGISELAERWGISKSVVKKWLHYLHDTGRIVIESCPHGSVVTICNWEVYQSGDDEPCPLSVHSENTARTLREHCENLSEERKNIRKKERKKTNVGIRLDYPQEFLELWESYGRRGDKKAAFQEYSNLKLSPEESQNLLKAVSNFVKMVPELKFRPHFCRFLKTDWREHLTLSAGGASRWKWAEEQGLS